MKNYGGNKLKKITQILFVGILCTILIGCLEVETYENGDTKLISEVNIGGEYNAKILYQEIYLDENWYTHTQIQYEKDGNTYVGEFIPYSEDAHKWILENTSEASTILCWWRYGHMVEGYSERNAIASSPSLFLKDKIELLTHINDEKINQYIDEIGGWTSNEAIEEISKILTTINISSNETQDILKKHNIDYILTHEYDSLNIAWIFFETSGKNPDDYIISGTMSPTKQGEKTLIYQMWNDEPEISELQLVYEHHPMDGFYDVRIFKIVD